MACPKCNDTGSVLVEVSIYHGSVYDQCPYWEACGTCHGKRNTTPCPECGHWSKAAARRERGY